METLPITSKCPIGGEEWPTSSYKSSCDTLPPKGKQSARTVHFICPAEHLFSLGEAVRAGVFTQQQKRLIVQQAQALVDSKLAPFKVKEQVCRVCGCTNEHGCIIEGGEGEDIISTCHWVEADICSACAGKK